MTKLPDLTVIIVWFGLGKDILLPWYKSGLSMVKPDKRLGLWVEIGHHWMTVTIEEHLGLTLLYWWPRDDWCLCGSKNLNWDHTHTCRDKHKNASTFSVFPWEKDSFWTEFSACKEIGNWGYPSHLLSPSYPPPHPLIRLATWIF
jgi:hypothetical protein